MGIFSWIILGGIAGWIASLVMNTNEEQGLISNILVGIAGALIGGFLFSMFGGGDVSGLNIYSLIVATAGSVVLLGFLRLLRRA